MWGFIVVRTSLAVRAAVAGSVLALVPAVAGAATLHPSPVATKGVTYTPQVVPTTEVPYPHVDAIATGGGTTYAAGLFNTVTGTTERLDNIVAFDTLDGSVKHAFDASFNGQVWDVELDTATNSLFVAGDYTVVNGVTRSGLVKLDATTGAIKDAFKPYFSTGKVNDVSLVTVAGKRRLIIGGGMSKKLASVDPETGKDDGYLAVSVADAIPNAWGGVAIYRLAVDPTGTRLIATGNFQTVGGQPRTRFFMLDLGATSGTVADWYYQPFAKPCASTAPRRIAYLQGVDWSPTEDGVFNVVATGQIPKYKEDIWHHWNTDAYKAKTTVCDAVGRFSVADSTKPVWINYTGGDSVWRVQDTGSAVYVSGHFQWLDNPDGFGSKPAICTETSASGQCIAGIGDKTTGSLAARRLGIGAVNPTTGRALDWAPNAPGYRQGGKSLVATQSGLWIGNDSKKFGRDPHYGLAFAPLK